MVFSSFVAMPKRSLCNLYLYPTAGTVVNSSEPLSLQWNNTCFTDSPDAVDIFLYEPYGNTSKLFSWQGVNYGAGSLQVQLMPRWWNDVPNVQLQFSIQEHGNPFGVEFGPGPLFNATYNPTGTPDPNADTSVHDGGFAKVWNFIKTLPAGTIAAAVIVPVLVIIAAIFIYLYVKRSRAKVADRRRRFSVALDKHMSTASVNWQPISAAGANAAIRNSIAAYGRPSGDTVGTGRRPAASTRTGAQGQRVSRVSFAVESYYSRDSGFRGSRFDDLPPIPTRRQETSDDTLGRLSPTQQVGAFSLSAAEIRARLNSPHPYARGADLSNNKDDDVLPALAMMDDGALLSPKVKPAEAPLPPVPAAAPYSPLAQMPMARGAELGMGPDQLMRQYAALRNMPTSPAPVRNLTSPAPVAVAHDPFKRQSGSFHSSAYSGIGTDV